MYTVTVIIFLKFSPLAPSRSVSDIGDADNGAFEGGGGESDESAVRPTAFVVSSSRVPIFALLTVLRLFNQGRFRNNLLKYKK